MSYGRFYGKCSINVLHMANTRKYLPDQVEAYERRVKRIKRAVKNTKFKSYIALTCFDNPALSPKMISNVLHNSKWLYADEVLIAVEKTLKITSHALQTA